MCICLFLIETLSSSFTTYKLAFSSVCTSGDRNELQLLEICCFFIKRKGLEVRRRKAWKQGFGGIGV